MPQFTLKTMLAVMLLAGLVCWVNRDAPAFAALGSVGAILLLAGDCFLRAAREAKETRFAVTVAAGAMSLAAGLWFLSASVLTALARRANFD